MMTHVMRDREGRTEGTYRAQRERKREGSHERKTRGKGWGDSGMYVMYTACMDE